MISDEQNHIHAIYIIGIGLSENSFTKVRPNLLTRFIAKKEISLIINKYCFGGLEKK